MSIILSDFDEHQLNWPLEHTSSQTEIGYQQSATGRLPQAQALELG
jgi:hypothetical protein